MEEREDRSNHDNKSYGGLHVAGRTHGSSKMHHVTQSSTAMLKHSKVLKSEPNVSPLVSH